MTLAFVGIQSNISNHRCLNTKMSKQHERNLLSLVSERNNFGIPKFCSRRSRYRVNIKGSITNE